jgi:tetrahydromethanopterin S-methyltransferase subunit G
MHDDLVKVQLEWIAKKVDKIEQKVDRMNDRLNVSFGKMMGACAVLILAAQLAMDYFRR